MVLHRDSRAMDRLGIEACVQPVRDRNFAKGFGGASGVMQVAHGAHAKTLRGGGPTPAHVELVVPFRGCNWNRAAWHLPTHSTPRAAVHRTEAHDGFGVAGFKQADSMGDQRLGARATTEN